jgi:hydroxypyruvate reductase
MAEEYLRLARGRLPRSAIVRVAEPSLAVPAATGRGGRSTHLATLVGQSLPQGWLFMAAATDGVDGPSGTAGAIVDGTFGRRVGGSVFADSLERFDTGSLHLAMKTALPLHPTGHNLADLHVLLRW